MTMNPDRLKVPVDSDSGIGDFGIHNSDRTPSRRGHRHKRSLAISQDLDFVKQGPGTPNDKPDYTTASPVRNQDISPRFFMSEELTYSHDIPNAIIDLDDALTTKPRSFTSHRRAESAPANLILPFKLEPPSTQSKPPLRIEEEDSESDGEPTSQDALMSPLRAKSQSPFLKNPTVTESPKTAKRSLYNNNTLKISKQKERYLNYTKHFPAASPQLPTQLYPQDPSSSSLSSDLTSGILTPAVTNSPNTPVFSVLKFTNGSPSPRNSFNFRSQVYDLPSNISAVIDEGLHLPDSNVDDGDTLTCTTTNATYEPVHRRSKSAAACDNLEAYRIPKEILLGEPGGSIDLSAQPKSPIKAVARSSNVQAANETRSISDGAVTRDKVSSQAGKRKSKFNIITNIFSRFKSPR